jgi:hypothetical protein
MAAFLCDEMAAFLCDESDVTVSVCSIGRALASIGWTKKVTRRIANERNADLRGFYLHKLSELRSYQLVYIDESACDNRVGYRRTGWSPVGIAPVEIARFHHDHRHQILPVYTQEGVLLSRVYLGSTDGELFEDFIEQLLHHCRPHPESNSVLIMDNAFFMLKLAYRVRALNARIQSMRRTTKTL